MTKAGKRLIAAAKEAKNNMNPRNEGQRDRRNGATIWQNPYATMTRAYTDWENGWLEQDEHMRKAT